MNRPLNFRLISSLLLSVAVLVVGTAPGSFAASASPKPKTSAKATTAPKPMTKITKPPAIGNDRGGPFASITKVQRACLVKQGIKLPAPGATGVRPTGTPNPSRSPGAFRNGGTFNTPKAVAVFKKCGVVLPTGGFGGAEFNTAKFQKFQKCMTSAGFTATGGFGRYDQSDPDTAAALIKCEKSTGFKLPSRGQPGSSN